MDGHSLQILHEDNHLLAVAKPAGLLVQGDRSKDWTLLDQVRSYLRARYDKPGNVYVGLVHRLDRPVSGVVLLAKTSKAASRLSRQFRDGAVGKRYLAVVQGEPEPPEAELLHHLAARGDERGVTYASAASFADSRLARLRYHVRGRAPGRSLLEIELLTGRRHQIRAQLAVSGWPVLGDVKYGADARPELLGIALHGWRLDVAHPVKRVPMRFVAPLPPDWPWPPVGLQTVSS